MKHTVVVMLFIIGLLGISACTKQTETTTAANVQTTDGITDTTEAETFTGYITKLTSDRILIVSDTKLPDSDRHDALWLDSLGQDFKIGQHVKATLFGEIATSYPGIGGASSIDIEPTPVVDTTKRTVEQVIATAITSKPDMIVPTVTNISYNANTQQWFIGLLDGQASEPREEFLIVIADEDGTINTALPQSVQYLVSNLELTVPQGWTLNATERYNADINDENGNNLGNVTSYAYADDWDFKFYKPNHSEITTEETIDTPLGAIRLYTLDADNGTAASGIEGTHDVYYAVVTIKNKVIYLLEFSNNDKDAATKKQFVELLNGLRVKVR